MEGSDMVTKTVNSSDTATVSEDGAGNVTVNVNEGLLRKIAMQSDGIRDDIVALNLSLGDAVKNSVQALDQAIQSRKELKKHLEKSKKAAKKQAKLNDGFALGTTLGTVSAAAWGVWGVAKVVGVLFPKTESVVNNINPPTMG